MNLNALIGESRFIVGQGRPDAPLHLPPFEFGNVCPIQLRAWKKSLDGSLIAEDLSTYDITLLVGPPNTRPTLGFWQVTTTFGPSRAISSRASAEDVSVALGDTFGPVVVTGGNGSYIVTLIAPGVWVLPTATFQGNTLSGVLVFEITPGTADTPAQYRIEVLEVAPARIIPENWSAGNTVPANTFTQVSGKLWKLILSPLVDNGFFTLTVDGVTTKFLNFCGGVQNIEVALSTVGRPADIAPDGTGGYWVSFINSVTTASVGGNLVILPYSTGNLDLSSTGIRELLDGLQFAPVKLSVVLVKDGQVETVAVADVMLTMPINQPATITIDAPQMAGITFSFSDDGAYMEVWKDGEHIADVALNKAA